MPISTLPDQARPYSTLPPEKSNAFNQTAATKPSLAVRLSQIILNNAIEMPLNFGYVYGVTWVFGAKNPGNHAAVAAFSVPIRSITSYCIPKILGCKPETPWRNTTAMVVNTIATNALSAMFCNQIGYQIDVRHLMYMNALGLIQYAGFTKINHYLNELANELDGNEEQENAKEETIKRIRSERIQAITNLPELDIHLIEKNATKIKEKKEDEDKGEDICIENNDLNQQAC